jgi:hypothetical protein
LASLISAFEDIPPPPPIINQHATQALTDQVTILPDGGRVMDSLFGKLVTEASLAKDLKGIMSGFFIFSEINVRVIGKFRLQFLLYDLGCGEDVVVVGGSNGGGNNGGGSGDHGVGGGVGEDAISLTSATTSAAATTTTTTAATAATVTSFGDGEMTNDNFYSNFAVTRATVFSEAGIPLRPIYSIYSDIFTSVSYRGFTGMTRKEEEKSGVF